MAGVAGQMSILIFFFLLISMSAEQDDGAPAGARRRCRTRLLPRRGRADKPRSCAPCGAPGVCRRSRCNSSFPGENKDTTQKKKKKGSFVAAVKAEAARARRRHLGRQVSADCHRIVQIREKLPEHLFVHLASVPGAEFGRGVWVKRHVADHQG